MEILRGYDGIAYRVGNRVELHPDFVREESQRFGTVVGTSQTPADRVHVVFEGERQRVYLCSQNALRFAGIGSPNGNL